MYEALSWLISALAAVMMLMVIVGAILAGLALRFVAEFLRELGNGRQESSTQEGRKDEAHRRR